MNVEIEIKICVGVLMEKVKQYYEKIARQYDESLLKWGYKRVIDEFLKSMKFDLPEKPRILDLGCGTGIAMHKLQEMYPQAELIGLDISKSMLTICREKFPDVFLIQGDYNSQEFQSFADGKSYDFSFRSFDLIISTGSLTEYGDQDRVLPFLYKLLKPGGYLANIGHQKGIVNIIVLHFWKGRSISKNTFKKKCLRAGFEAVEDVPMPFYKSWRKYGVVARVATKPENFKLEKIAAGEKKLKTTFE